MSKSCKNKLVKLYSSVNFKDPADSKNFGKWDICSKLKILIHFVGQYSKENQPDIYFKAKVTLDASVNEIGEVKKCNICVKDICFKNEFDVSICSRTDQYKYLYDVSCSSSSSCSKSSKSSCSKSSKSYCSSELSLSDIIANGIEKQIINNVKDFIESDAFLITWEFEQGSFTLDTTQYNNGLTFPNVKMTIKYKFIKHHSSCSSSSSSCHSSSSSCSSHKPNHFIKMLMMGFISLMIIMFLLKLLGYNSCPNSYNEQTGYFNQLTYMFKNTSYQNTQEEQPEQQPEVQPEQQPEEQPEEQPEQGESYINHITKYANLKK